MEIKQLIKDVAYAMLFIGLIFGVIGFIMFAQSAGEGELKKVLNGPLKSYLVNIQPSLALIGFVLGLATLLRPKVGVGDNGETKLIITGFLAGFSLLIAVNYSFISNFIINYFG